MITKEELLGLIDGGLGLDGIIKAAVRDIVVDVLRVEAERFIEAHNGMRLEDGRQRVVLNGFQPERQILTVGGVVKVRPPRVRDLAKTGARIEFSSKMLPRYLRRTSDIESVIPWLYLRGVPMSGLGEVFACLYGERCKGLSATTVSKLMGVWAEDFAAWRKRDMGGRRFVYLWADGVYFGVRGERDNQCVMALIGVEESGRKELVGLGEGFAESADSWKGVFQDLKLRGMGAPLLTIGDGALGLWAGLRQVYPDCVHGHCWAHKLRDVKTHLPKSRHSMAASRVKEIYMAESRREAERQMEAFAGLFGDKYPKAAAAMDKNREALLAFFDFPARHWASLRTSNPIESVFSTVRLRTGRTRAAGSRSGVLSMVFKLCELASSKFRAIPGAGELGMLAKGLRFKDGAPVKGGSGKPFGGTMAR